MSSFALLWNIKTVKWFAKTSCGFVKVETSYLEKLTRKVRHVNRVW